MKGELSDPVWKSGAFTIGPKDDRFVMVMETEHGREGSEICG